MALPPPRYTFQLSKWYLDCVSESGDVSIIYTGTVQWRGMRLNYSSLLDCTRGCLTSRRSLRKMNAPQAERDSISWSSKPFNLMGKWQSRAVALHETVFESRDGAVEWECLMPCAKSQIDQRTGLGYVEHLAMTISPWKLPIRCLRWGRFTSKSDWAVWIDWAGEYNRRIAFVNGEARATEVLEDGRVGFADGDCLEMDRSMTLRDGPLCSTALSSIPGARNTFPARLLQVRERKWRSRARLERRDRSAVEGWALHEIVTWPE
jgi:hypothetical protein